MVEINGKRLLHDLAKLREFGSSGNGVVRQTFSDIDMASRHWLRDQMQSAGLDAVIDGVSTVYGRSSNPGPALLIGSHTDTQPEGGWLDGAMGVIYALEVARALREDPDTAHLAVDIASWADEEGTYANFLGSRSFVGEYSNAELSDGNAEGESTGEALERLGLADVERVRLNPRRHIGFLEAHIEQGPFLEETGKQIGVVSSIVGIRAMQITCTGEQNHAGTTPMNRRKDAGAALFEFGVRIRERLSALAGPASVWTIGNAQLLPGGESIIPGSAWCGLQFRDADDRVLDAFEEAIRELAAEMTDAGPVAVHAELRRAAVPAAHMDNDLRSHLAAAAEARVPGNWVDMPSAAAHDAMIFARHLPSAMLFIPSINGISHDFAEDSSHADIVTGCQVLADAAVSVLAAATAA